MSGPIGRFSANSLRRMISSLNSIRFRDEVGEVEYFGQKVILMRRDAFELMRKELSRVAGEAAYVILSVAGRRVGTEEGRALMAKAQTLGLTSPDAFPEFVRTVVEETNMGIGKIRVQNLAHKEGTVNLMIQNGFEAEKTGESQRPICFFTLGYLEGVFSRLLGRDVRGKEVACKARSDDCCRFDLTAESTR